MVAARIWWMFRLFGHDNVFVLNGGFSAWKKVTMRERTDHTDLHTDRERNRLI